MYPAKTCRPIGVWSWGSARLKTYILAADTDEVGADVLRSARYALDSATEQPAASGEVGFVIVHRCGAQHLLLACTWREGNELWETVWQNTSGPFALLDRSGHHKPSYCVWEMGVVTHEAYAWRHALNDGIDDASIKKYLNDSLLGEV